MMEDILERAVEIMRAQGAQFCDARFQTVDGLGIRLVDGAVRDLSDDHMAGVCLRARVGGVWGTASTVALDRQSVSDIAIRAVRSAGMMRGNDMEAPPTVKRDMKAELRIHPRDMDVEQKIGELMHLDKAQALDRIVNRNTNYSEEVRNNLLVNSSGSVISWEEVRTRFFAFAVAKEGDRTEMYYDGKGGSAGFELVMDADLPAIGEHVAKEAIATLEAERPPQGRMTVISDPSVSGLLAHEVMGHASEADEVVKRRSFLTDRVGDTVASELITMVDDGTCPGAFGYIPFDDEGTPSSRSVIIKDGVYNGFMHTLETASAMGVPTTGNGRAQDFSHRVWARMTNTYFEAGDWTLEELLEGVKDGVLSDRMTCGMEDPVGGGFEAKVLRGFRVVDGEISGMVRSLTLTGDALSILRTTDGMGNELRLDPGYCGKGIEDWVPVSGGGPYCRSQITVGGA